MYKQILHVIRETIDVLAFIRFFFFFFFFKFYPLISFVEFFREKARPKNLYSEIGNSLVICPISCPFWKEVGFGTLKFFSENYSCFRYITLVKKAVKQKWYRIPIGKTIESEIWCT
jgi:hypothetical protein